jgi:hypothetical protein
MASPLPTLFGRHHTKQLDLDQPDGCDHDQNVYHYRLVDGAMVLRGIALGHGWENRQMDWRGLSCYKRKEDEQMAQITQESGRPEPRADKDEIMAKAKVLIDGGMKVAQAARELGVPGGTLAGWISKERRQAEKARRLLESVDGGRGLQDKATDVVICRDCGQGITGTVFQSSRGPRCFECAVNNTPSPIAAPIGVEVPQYEPADNDFVPDDEPIPYVATPSPLDAQIDIMLDALWSEKRAKLKAHLKPLLADAEAWEMVKCIVSRGLA